MNTGILIVAVGHGNYGKLAATLAMSIKGNGSKYPIHLVYTESTLKAIGDDYINFFDSKSQCPDEYLLNNGEQCFIKVKSYINELTPFDNTLFLDSDIIMINNGMLDTIIDEVKDVDFTVKNSGFTAYDSDKITNESIQWANLLEIKQAYGFTNEDIWNVHSEFIWWKKGHPLFAKWIENFENIRVKNIEFAGCIPDELPLWIAMCQLGVDCHKANYHPTFWPMDSTKQLRLKDLKDDYCGVSIGGNRISEVQLTTYNNLVQIHALRMNMRYKFLQQPKRRWAPERHTY